MKKATVSPTGDTWSKRMVIDIVRYKFYVSGRVQGVGFRYHVQMQAGKLKLSGFVRNLENGDVYIEVQGEAEPIAVFRQAIEHDIPFARVDEIKAQSAELVPDETKFKVKY